MTARPAKAWTDFATFMKMSRQLPAAWRNRKPRSIRCWKSSKASRWSPTGSGKIGREMVGEANLKGIRLTVHRGPRKIDGNGVMMKITTIPKGMRSQGWMGPVDSQQLHHRSRRVCLRKRRPTAGHRSGRPAVHARFDGGLAAIANPHLDPAACAWPKPCPSNGSPASGTA